MITGLAPTELLGGGRNYFDALLAEAQERRRIGWEVPEMLATLIEVQFASYRALLALGGAKTVPDPLKIPRPWQEKKRERVSWRELQAFLGGRRGD
jgi:hypothetical protein